MRWFIAVMAALCVQVAAAEAGKVGVVDMERALFLSDAAKVSIKQFEADNKTDIEKLKGLETDLLALKEKTEKDGDVMSDDERRKLANDYEQKSTEYKFYGRKLQQLEQKWKREFFQTQLPQLEKLLKAIIDEGGYDVVLQSGAVIYSSPKTDLTKLLLERLNAK
ncbi:MULTISPECIES: OmpH family outer membrane protein [unclassified Thalassolituus]|jgi:outer membrane protein|uniref:OmpH family outer membrane protein n=1 Tax=Oceanospirillaceae TaxID=135620 RepID=UPI000C47D9A9|nr:MULTISPECIES: OmpH family outer membrane protein [unclassified Thalassolituus]MAY14515.1 hypothetical protein [Oceanospirillaceae bacterium]MCA6058540.1 OmpH family outer membrane protein [Thalassolituus sp. ST750PaO-4]TVV42024.1 OmpH family outer membrane protein [Thalassolituus sp. C2-1]|tara:strand:+ start:1577 stop:2071 length:495 start_codon:yes stop_codon:yes gene_type:complete